jgi:hypothetical protein
VSTTVKLQVIKSVSGTDYQMQLIDTFYLLVLMCRDTERKKVWHIRVNSVTPCCEECRALSVCFKEPHCSPGYLSSTSLGYGQDDRRFESRQGLGIYFFTTASIPALGLTQPRIQWLPGALSLGIKRPGHEAKVKNA